MCGFAHQCLYRDSLTLKNALSRIDFYAKNSLLRKTRRDLCKLA